MNESLTKSATRSGHEFLALSQETFESSITVAEAEATEAATVVVVVVVVVVSVVVVVVVDDVAAAIDAVYIDVDSIAFV